MPANPYYVEPAGDYSGQLKGLQGVVGDIRANKDKEDLMQAKASKMAGMRQEVSDAYESKDPDQIEKVRIKYPEMSNKINQALSAKFPGEAGNELKRAYEMAATDFVQAPRALENLRKAFAADGIDPQEQAKLDEFQNLIDSDPETAEKNIKADFLFMADDDQLKRYQDMTKSVDGKTPTTAMGQYIKRNPNATAEKLIDFTQKLKAGGTSTTGKTYSKKNPDGSTRTIKNVKPGSIREKQLLESNFVEGSQTVGAKLGPAERKQERINKAADKLSAMANEDPNKFYENHSYRQNEDGSLFIDPVTGGPQELQPFTNTLGKRGNMKAVIGLGEQRDDAIELTELLELPSVQANLKKAEGAGFWDQAKSKWTNAINKWMQDQGIKGDSPTATAIARIQRMASEERKLYMGTAVTDNEMKSALAWMPNAGDSFDSVMNKTRLMGQEADQAFRRYVDVAEGAGADMSPFMKAFGIKKFGAEQMEQPKQSDMDNFWE